MKNPQRQRILLFLGGCGFILLGTYVMVFGDTRIAGSVGGMLAGMGMIVNLAQLLFKLPFDLPQHKRVQGMSLFLPSSYLPKKKQQQVELILPASYYDSLKKRQKTERDRFFKDVLGAFYSLFLFVSLAIPFLGIVYLFVRFLPPPPPLACIIVAKQTKWDAAEKKYALDLTVQWKYRDSRDDLSTPGPASYPIDYTALQAAQNELNHLFVGRSYPCHFVSAGGGSAGVPIPESLFLDSDIPLSLTPNKDGIFWQLAVRSNG